MGTKYRDLVRKHSKARGSARSVLNTLASYADDDGLAWPGRATIANETGMSERNVIRCIQRLCEERRLSIELNELGGRGKVPIYKIWLPEIGQAAPLIDDEDAEKGDNLSPKRVSTCHPLDAERVTNEQTKGDKLSEKGDKSDNTYKEYNRIEPNTESKRESGAKSAPHSARAKGKTDGPPYVDPRRFENGYIPAGKARNAVEVYYERFPITATEHRLSAPLEDDLVHFCKDLDLLREVVTEYHRENYKKPRNIRLILDWYNDPSRFRNNHNGTSHQQTQGNYGPPAVANFTQREWDEWEDPNLGEIPY